MKKMRDYGWTIKLAEWEDLEGSEDGSDDMYGDVTESMMLAFEEEYYPR